MPANFPTGKNRRSTSKTAKFTGLRTADSPREVGLDGLVKAENVDITRKQRIKRRRGQTLSALQDSDSGYISDGVGMITNNSDLIYIDGDLSLTTVRSDLTPGGSVTFYKYGNRIYYSNGFETGVFDNGINRTLGLDRPAAAPEMASTSGDLDQGRLTSACSFVRFDGQESGLSQVGLLEDHEGGVSFSNIPISADPDVEYTRVYLSHPSGDQLFRAVQVANGITSASYKGHQTFLAAPEKTAFLDKPISFYDVDLFNSRMVYAGGDYLFYSEPFSFELIDFRFNWFDLGGRISVIGAVPGGLYVATENETWYLGGADLKGASLRKVADYGAVPKTRRYINGNLLGGDDFGDTPLPVWTGGTGFVIGADGGRLVNVSEKDFVLPSGIKGTAMFRKEAGQHHYVAVIKA